MNKEKMIVVFQSITHRAYDETNDTHNACIDMMLEDYSKREYSTINTSLSLGGVSESFEANFWSKPTQAVLKSLTRNVVML